MVFHSIQFTLIESESPFTLLKSKLQGENYIAIYHNISILNFFSLQHFPYHASQSLRGNNWLLRSKSMQRVWRKATKAFPNNNYYYYFTTNFIGDKRSPQPYLLLVRNSTKWLNVALASWNIRKLWNCINSPVPSVDIYGIIILYFLHFWREELSSMYYQENVPMFS